MGEKEQRLDEQARAEGWTSRGQKYRAAKAGITDPAEWAARTRASGLAVAEHPDTDTGSADAVTWSEPSLDDHLTETLTLDLQGGDTGTVQHLPIDRVHPAGDNPRRTVDTDDDMVASIRAIGILQPLIVMVHPDDLGHWLIVAGHRRHAAATAAGLTTVPALVREFTPVERVEAMLVENLQRKDLDPFDEAHGFRQLRDLGRTQREIADRVGRNQSHVSRRLKLVDLEPGLIDHFTAGRVTLRVIEELAVAHPAVRHAAIGVIAKSPDIHESNIIPKAEKIVAEAEARLAAKESGLPEWTGKSWDVSRCEQSQATHWMLEEKYDAGRWIPTLVWVRERPTDIPGGSSYTPDPEEVERRRQERAAAEAAQAARKARTEQRRAFIAEHLDDLGDLAIRLMVPAITAYFHFEDEVQGALRLLGHDVPDMSIDDDFSPIDAWNDLAEKATTKRQTMRMFTARIIDGADEQFAGTPAPWQDTSWRPVYLASLAAVGWELDDAEQAIVTPPAVDADGITDDEDDGDE